VIVYVAHVQTESSDHYTWVYDYEPTRSEVIARLWRHEGCESLEFYIDTTSVRINKETVITR